MASSEDGRLRRSLGPIYGENEHEAMQICFAGGRGTRHIMGW